MGKSYQDGFFIVAFKDLAAITVDQGEDNTEEERRSCERPIREDTYDTKYDRTFE